jgi:hypothetical protein
LSLLLITLLLIGLTELACRAIPAHDGFGTFSDVINMTVKRDAMGDLTETLTDSKYQKFKALLVVLKKTSGVQKCFSESRVIINIRS